jgi:hypothetical protein
MTEVKPLRGLIEPPVAGYWGSDERTIRASRGAYVIRNGDAAGVDQIDPRTLPLRWFAPAEIAKARCEPGDVVLVSSGEVGDAVPVTKLPNDFPTIVSNFVRRVRAAAGVFPGWLGHVMRWSESKRVAQRVSGGTTLTNLSSTFFDQFLIHVPGEREQRRIAEILDTIDEAIQISDGLIAKKQDLHAALATSLLADGGDSQTLAEIVDPRRPVTYGIVQPGPRQPEGTGVPIIRGQDYDNGLVTTEGLYWVQPHIAAPYGRSVLQGEDVLLSIVGVYVGTVGQVPPQLGGANLTQTTARIAITAPNVPRYFFHQMIGPTFQGEVRKYTKGSAQPGLNLSDVERMVVHVPSVEDQKRVVAVLDASVEAIATEQRELGKLRSLRLGLASDLLSGRMRTVRP